MMCSDSLYVCVFIGMTSVRMLFLLLSTSGLHTILNLNHWELLWIMLSLLDIYLYNFIAVCRYMYIVYQCVPIYLYNFIGVCQDHYFKRPRQGRADVNALATVCLSAFSLSRCSSVCDACWSVCLLACVPFYICSSNGTILLEAIKPLSIV